LQGLEFRNDAAQIAAAALLARESECLKSADQLLRKGRLIAAFTVLRSAVEADFCLAALVNDAELTLDAMKHNYLRETKREYEALKSQGYESLADGRKIQEALRELVGQLEAFRQVPRHLSEIAEIGTRQKSYQTTYQLCCQRSHPHSLIATANDQFGPGDDGVVRIRTDYKDVICSNDFLIVAECVLAGMESASKILGFELDGEYQAIRTEFDAVTAEFQQ
jgi:hypothetical protein